MPKASMSRCGVKPRTRSGEPVPVPLVLAEQRVEALEQVLVRATPGVMDAHRVVGGDRPVEEAPARPTGVLRPQPGERPTLTPRLEQLVFLGDQIGLRGDGSEHATPGLARGLGAGNERPRIDRKAPRTSPSILRAMQNPQEARPRA